jgi:peptide/nickel transport system ATP-binding protein
VPDPSRRGTKREVANDEIRSPVRAPDYQPPIRQHREVSPGHVVQVWGEEWSA